MSGKQAPAPKARGEMRARLRVEMLEDRAVPAVANLLIENFDGVATPNLPAGWTTQTLAGTANNWFTTITAPAAPSAPNAAAGINVATFSDSVLLSPVVNIANLSTAGDPLARTSTLTLSFRDFYSIENPFDGAVLEVSINGGAFQDILAAGGTFTTGGYTGTVTNTVTPPPSNLQGRRAWTGNSPGLPGAYETTVVNLTNVLRDGDTVQFRWRISSDNSVGVVGFALDNVLLQANNPFDPNRNEKIAIGTGGGVQSTVNVYDARGNLFGTLNPFPGFRGEIHTATGDVTGDGVQDVVCAAGARGGPMIVCFDGASGRPVRAFYAFAANYTGGVNVAVGDTNGDGFAEIIATPASRGIPPIVNVFDGRTALLTRSFAALPPVGSIQGLTVAAGDINGDRLADIVIGAGRGAPPVVVAYDGASGNAFYATLAYSINYSFGVNVAVGDFNSDRRAEIFTAPALGSAQVNIIDGRTLTPYAVFAPYEPLQAVGGVRIGTTDSDGDGVVEILTANGPVPGFSAPQVRRFNTRFDLFAEFFPFEGVYMGGGFVG